MRWKQALLELFQLNCLSGIPGKNGCSSKLNDWMIQSCHAAAYRLVNFLTGRCVESSMPEHFQGGDEPGSNG